MTAEQMQEILKLLREETERHEAEKKANRHAYQRVFNEFGERFSEFDWTHVHEWTDAGGRIHESKTEYNAAYRLRSAIGMLLQIKYKVRGVRELPASKEQEIREFVSDILALMKQTEQRARV